MTVQEFMGLFIDPDTQKFEIWDTDTEEAKFCGYMSDIDDMEDVILNATVVSVDNIEKDRDIITLNVEF